MRRQNSPEEIAWMAEQGRLPSSSGRGFRSRDGAPTVRPKGGLIGGMDMEVDKPDREMEWGGFFGKNSAYGGRPGSGDPYGTAANPIRFGASEIDAITANRLGSQRSNRPFMPDQSGSKLVLPKPLTGPGGNAQTDANALARNMAETQPGGMASYLPPVQKSVRPSWSAISDTPAGAPNFRDLTDEGLGAIPGQSVWGRTKFASNNPVTAMIEKKYGNPKRPGFLSF